MRGVAWYQGEAKPKVWTDGGIPKRGDGILFVGDKGMLLVDYNMFLLLPQKTFADFAAPEPTLPRTPGHHREWVDACRGQAMPLSNFAYASVLTEALLVGNLALRTGGTVEWNAGAMGTGSPSADAFVKPEFRNGWSFD